MSAAGRDAPPRRVLAPCPRSPNCVCSRAADARHRVEPIAYHGSREQGLAALLAALRAQPRTRVLRADPEHVHAVQRSRWLGFVDDLECELPPGQGVIHVRSASRSGYYDLGVNRARVERLRREIGRRLAAGTD